MMTKKEKIKYIIDTLNREVTYTQTEYIRAASEIAAAKTGHNLWEEGNKDNGVGTFGTTNPYHVESKKERAKDRLNIWLETKEVLDFAIITFIDMIEEE